MRSHRLRDGLRWAAIVFALGCLLLPVTGGATAGARSSAVAGPLGSAAAAHVLGQNLLVNPDAEHGLDGWTTVSSFLAESYGGDGLPSEEVSKSIGGGARFFAGGPDTSFSSATQELKVSDLAAQIDAGSIVATLGAFVGGARGEADEGIVVLTFLDEHGQPLGDAVKLPPVTASDRGGATTLLSRGNSGAVPKGTRILRVELLASRFDGGYDDAYFDNLRVVLTEIKPENHEPVAVDDRIETTPGTAAQVNVLANDSDADDDDLTVTGNSDPAYGDAKCSAEGICTYAPDAGFAGDDAFTYTSSDGQGGTAVGTVRVRVAEGMQNAAPVAVDDSLETDQGVPGTVDVLANDSDPDGQALTVTDSSDPAGGSVSCTAAGVCTYTPDPGFFGTDSFDYTVSDGLASDTGTVNVLVFQAPVSCPRVGAAVDEGGMLVGESWIECSGSNANAVAGGQLLMTTGDAAQAAEPQDVEASLIQGTSLRGAFDVSILRLDVLVPTGADCLTLDATFQTEEFPESLADDRFNDGFVAELDQSSWTVNGSTIVAPNNFALGPNDVFMSVTGIALSPDTGTVYDGGSERIAASTPAAPGMHSLFLSIFEATDGSRDSAAFVDGLRSGTTIEGECVAGGGNPPPPPPPPPPAAAPPPPPPPPPPATPAQPADLMLSVTRSPETVAVGDVVTYTITITNNGPGTATGVTLLHEPAAGAEFDSVEATQGACEGTSVLVCTLGTLSPSSAASTPAVVAASPGSIATVVHRVRFMQAGDTTGTLTLQAATPDPHPGDNRQASPVTVLQTRPAAPTTPTGPSTDPNDNVPNPGETVVAGEVSGAVLVKLPGSTAFVDLAQTSELPNGTVIDARKGRVRLTAANASGGTDVAEFYEGVFSVFQFGGPAAPGVTELQLAAGDFSPCRTLQSKPKAKKVKKPRKPKAKKAKTRTTAGVVAADPGKPVRRLWGTGKGNFRTRGRYSSATVRGTTWLTQDQCNGTLTRVVEGVVEVRDVPRRRTVSVRAGQSYLASPQPRRR